MTTKPMTAKQKLEAKVQEMRKTDPLYGYHFHVFGEGGRVQFQGWIGPRVDATHYLVTLFSWIIGEETESFIVPIEKMAAHSFGGEPGTWQLYENAEQMNFYYEHHSINARESKQREMGA